MSETPGHGFPPRAPIPAEAPMPPQFSVTFDDLQASARRALERMQSTSEAIAAIRVDLTDDDELVTVTVDGIGAMVGLRIADAAMGTGPDVLAALVVDTAAAAAGVAFAQMGGHIAAFTAAVEESG